MRSVTVGHFPLVEMPGPKVASCLWPRGQIEPAWVSWRLQTLERLESWKNSTPHRSGTRLS